MCSIEEAAAVAFQEFDKDGCGFVPASQVSDLVVQVYKKLERNVEAGDIEQIKNHMNSKEETSIYKDEFIHMVKDTIKEQGKVGNQSDV